MLSPSDYDRLCERITPIYDELENAIIEDMARRIIRMGGITESTKWQAKQLRESGMLYDDIISEILKRTDLTQNQVNSLFEYAGVQSVGNDNRRYRTAGLDGVVKMSDAVLQTLNAGIEKCNGSLQNLTLTTANTSQSAYINACNQAYMQVVSSAFSYQEAIKQAVRKTAQSGAVVAYPSGHRDRIDVAVRRSVLTGIGQTVRKISMINANDMGCDLMEITAHAGARPEHARWQGKIVSLSGRRGYLSLNDIGYGTGEGFGGWNCRHDWFPFFEGISEPAYTPQQLEKLDEKNISYNGKNYSEYEISQIQRRYEREIREARREQSAFRVATEEADNPELKQVMQESLNYANSLLKERQDKMQDLINQTSQNYPKENNRNSLTSPLSSGKMNSKKSDSFDLPIKPLSENAKEFQTTYMEQYSKKYPKYTEALTYRFNNGSKRMQNLFLDYVRLDSVADESFVGKNSYFDPNTKKIYMNFTLDFAMNGNGKGVGTVYFHEHGHLIDKALGDISYKNPKFIEQLYKDFSVLKNKIQSENSNSLTYGKLCEIISGQLQDTRTDCGVSDIINGLSHGVIKGCGYHDKKEDGSNYWNDRTICQEAFANMFDTQFDEQKYQKMKLFFPNALQEFENMTSI